MKQLENDVKLGQRLREKKLLKEQQQQQDSEQNIISQVSAEVEPKQKKVTRPRLKRTQSIFPPVFEDAPLMECRV